MQELRLIRMDRSPPPATSWLILWLAALLPAGPAWGDGATVTGVAKFTGTPPARELIDMTPTRGGEADECKSLHQEGHKSETALVSDEGMVANVFVYVKKGLPKKAEYPLPEQPAVLDQIGCMYRPRVQGVRVGQELVIKNSDPLTHNTRSYAFRNRPFNVAQPAGAEERTKVFTRPERAIQMGCDLHAWMKAFVFAMDHPFFAVTGADGKFTISGLPPGEYELEAWHEEFGEQEATVQLDADGNAVVQFVFSSKDT